MSYTAICIGGPWNGRVNTALEDVFHAAIPPTDPMSLTPLGNTRPESAKDFTYQFFTISVFSHVDKAPSNYSFWVDASIPMNQRSVHVMTTMMQNYGRL